MKTERTNFTTEGEETTLKTEGHVETWFGEKMD